jgi:hypothetical protein
LEDRISKVRDTSRKLEGAPLAHNSTAPATTFREPREQDECQTEAVIIR